jgi:hypothetical protein
MLFKLFQTNNLFLLAQLELFAKSEQMLRSTLLDLFNRPTAPITQHYASPLGVIDV